MRPSSHAASQGRTPSQSFTPPMRRYAHPISVTYPPSAVISEEGIQWIYAALYAQSVALEEIRALLQKGNNF